MREYSPPPCVTCHMSHVMYHVSHVTCHMSHDIITPKLCHHLDRKKYSYIFRCPSSSRSLVVCWSVGLKDCKKNYCHKSSRVFDSDCSDTSGSSNSSDIVTEVTIVITLTVKKKKKFGDKKKL